MSANSSSQFMYKRVATEDKWMVMSPVMSGRSPSPGKHRHGKKISTPLPKVGTEHSGIDLEIELKKSADIDFDQVYTYITGLRIKYNDVLKKIVNKPITVDMQKLLCTFASYQDAMYDYTAIKEYDTIVDASNPFVGDDLLEICIGVANDISEPGWNPIPEMATMLMHDAWMLAKMYNIQIAGDQTMTLVQQSNDLGKPLKGASTLITNQDMFTNYRTTFNKNKKTHANDLVTIADVTLLAKRVFGDDKQTRDYHLLSFSQKVLDKPPLTTFFMCGLGKSSDNNNLAKDWLGVQSVLSVPGPKPKPTPNPNPKPGCPKSPKRKLKPKSKSPA